MGCGEEQACQDCHDEASTDDSYQVFFVHLIGSQQRGRQAAEQAGIGDFKEISEGRLKDPIETRLEQAHAEKNQGNL
jgi:hypothetical protein